MSKSLKDIQEGEEVLTYFGESTDFPAHISPEKVKILEQAPSIKKVKVDCMDREKNSKQRVFWTDDSHPVVKEYKK